MKAATMPFEIANLILLLAAAQGLFLSILIFHKHGKLFANRFLSTMIFLYSAILLHLLLGELGYSITFPHFTLLIVGIGFLITPLHYLYALGYLGLFKSEIFAAPEIANSLSHLRQFDDQNQEQQAVQQQKPPKYEKSGLSDEKAAEYLRQLVDLMENKKPYTDSELTLNQLADMLEISPHNLSEVINTRLHQNFFDFVNQFRLEKVKKDLADPQKQNLKMLAIAFEAGFNSKSSFNLIFKKHTNLTPSEYRRLALRKPS